MLLRMKKSKYWIDIWDVLEEDGIDYDGYWVAFLRRNIRLNPEWKEEFESQIWKFLESTRMPKARISLPHYDRLIVFTTCDKGEICRTKLLMQTLIGINEKHLVWKAAFESRYQWMQGNWLDLMSLTFEKYEKLLDSNSILLTRDIIEARSLLYQRILEEMLMKRESMIILPKFNPIEYHEEKDPAFVLMPFGEKWSDDVYFMINQAGDSAGFTIARADDFFEPNIIIDDIWKSINRSSLIIADITVHNANVFYELGIAHTIGKEVVLIKQAGGASAPFDIAFWRYIEYENTAIKADDFMRKLEQVLTVHKTRVTGMCMTNGLA